MTTQNIMTEEDLIQSRVHYLKEIVKELKKIGFIVDDLTTQGDTKFMGVCKHPTIKIGRRIDIRLVTFDSFYPALLYFTGSMELNRKMRTVALQKGLTLNEYGLYRGETKIVVHSEKEIFDLLNLVYLEPKERDI
jgi:DNA polymerase/3'-5' exonuclease PolX